MSKNSTASRAALVGASVLTALVVGGVVHTPAAAAEPEDSAHALSASGLIDITKVPSVVGQGKDHLVHTALPDGANSLVRAGVFNAAVDEGYAKASTADAKLGLPGIPAISVGLVTAECEDGAGGTSVADLRVGGQEINLDQIAPNTEIIPDALQGVARITLNKQTDNGDGSLTVSALAVDLLDGTQRVDLSTATCVKQAAEPSEPEVPEPSEPEKPTEPTTPPEDDEDLPGAAPEEDGTAPTPVPQPGHLDVTG